jgi:hypothetical protein
VLRRSLLGEAVLDAPAGLESRRQQLATASSASRSSLMVAIALQLTADRTLAERWCKIGTTLQDERVGAVSASSS